jgi:hypothetical protein
MEPRRLERFSETRADEEPEPQMLTPYALERKAGCYVMVKNVEGLLRMLVFQGPERAGEKSVCIADLRSSTLPRRCATHASSHRGSRSQPMEDRISRALT